MIKNINKLTHFLVVIILFTSCKTVIKSHTADYDYMYISKTGIKQRPLVTDLEVGKVKLSLTKTYLNVSLSEAKENVLGDFVQQNGCDLVVQPFFETNTIAENDKRSVTITLMAYPAFYKNIRNFELKDTSAFILHSYTNVQNVPVIAPILAEPKAPSTAVSNGQMQLVNSLKNSKFGVSITGAMPTGNFKDFYKTGLGAGLNYLATLSTKTDFTMDINYQSFGGKKVNVFYSTDNISSIGVKLGFRYKPLDKFFIEPKAGYSFFTNSNLDGGFSYSLSAGYLVTKKTEVGLVYDNTALEGSNFRFLGLKIGFYF